MKVKRHASPFGLRYLLDLATKNKTVVFKFACGIILQILVIKFGYKGFWEIYKDKEVPLAGVIIKHIEKPVYNRQVQQIDVEYYLGMRFDSIGYHDIKVDKESYKFANGKRVVFNLSHLEYLPSKNVKGWYVSCIIVLFLEYLILFVAAIFVITISVSVIFKDGIPLLVTSFKEYRLNKRLRHRKN